MILETFFVTEEKHAIRVRTFRDKTVFQDLSADHATTERTCDAWCASDLR
jgi:hypothetical protein